MNVIMCVSECCGCCVALIIGVSAIVITGIICCYKIKEKKDEHNHEINKMEKLHKLKQNK